MPGTGLVLSSLVDAGDNSHATITVLGTPNGAISFLAGRTPDVSLASSVAATGAGPYSVALGNPGCWFVWVQDGDGESVTPGAVWLGGIDSILNDLGTKLRDILWSLAPGIEAALRKIYPDVTLKQACFGYDNQADQYPAVVVWKPAVEYSFVVAPYGELQNISAVISCILLYNTEVSELKEALQFGGAVAQLLNQPAYIDITLDSGLPLYACHVDSASAQIYQVDEGTFSATANLMWSAELLIVKDV